MPRQHHLIARCQDVTKIPSSATDFLGETDSQKTGSSRIGVQAARELLRLGPAVGVRLDLTGCKTPDLLTQSSVFVVFEDV